MCRCLRFWESPAYQKFHVEGAREWQLDTMLATPTFTDASHVLHARQTLGEAVSVVCADGEKALPFMHMVLVYLQGLASAPVTASHVGRYMPWRKIFRFVNGLSKYVAAESQSKVMKFPQQRNDAGRPLPEDFFSYADRLWR